jgi:hypothetical protein
MIDNDWLTEEYLKSLGYYQISDNGQYGVYKCEHRLTLSRTYGLLPKDYRTLIFNRDKEGVFISVSADWDTRYSAKNILIINKQEFATLLNMCI